MEEAAGFRQRHQWLEYAFLLLAGVAAGGFFCTVVLTGTSPPLFSVAVSGFEGLHVPSSDPGAAAAPTFHVVLRVENKDFLPRHCFTEGSAVVELDGVPLARTGRLGGFCVPGRTAVDVPFVATGGGLGLPDGVYERVRGGVPSLLVRVRLDGDRLAPMLVRCTVTLDGRPAAGCLRFLMLERGINRDEED